MALKGQDAMLARINEFIRDFPGVVGDAMYQEGTVIGVQSQSECPVEYGRLRASFYITKSGTNEDPSVTLGYGTEYAVYVHEMLQNKHPVGKAKFLEDPIIAAKPTWLQNIGRRASAMIKDIM